MRAPLAVCFSALVGWGGCASDRGGVADPAASSAVETAVTPSPAQASAAPSLGPPPLTTASGSPHGPAKSRIATEWSEYTQSIVSAPSDVAVNQLSASGWIDPTTEDFNDKRVGGFPIATKWGKPKTADFAAKLSAILLSDATYDFDIVTRCAPAKGVIGIVLHHAPTCAPTDICALDVVHVMMNFPCHQVFVTTRMIGPSGAGKGQTWAAHFGPAKDEVLDLLTEGYPDKAAVLKALR